MSLTLPFGHEQEPDEYLRSLPPADRRTNGRVYTPRHLVEFILDRAGYPDHPDSSVLDPACGAGIFLQVAAERLAAALQRDGLALHRSSGRRTFLAAVEKSLFGVDLDGIAADIAKREIRATVARLCGQAPPSDFFERNVIQADFLTSPQIAPLASARSGFDFVVGNPPYVSAGRIAADYKQRLRKSFLTARGRMDFYTLFIEHSIHQLRQHGRLAFITPDKYLASQTSEPLRRLLLDQGAVRLVARFRSHKVFEDAATVPCVTIYERGGRQSPITLLECSDRSRPDGHVEIRRTSSVKATALTTNAEWRLAAPVLERLADTIQASHPALKTLLVRLSAGIATGRDDVFVVPAGARHDLEEELLHPTVRGRDLQPFQITDSGLRILVPYTFDPLPQLIDIDRYPGARRYLHAQRAALAQRHCVRVWQKSWYDVHDPIPLDIGRTPKILVPDIASHNRFVFDPGRYWPLHSAYYLVPLGAEPRFLTALLNSTPIEFLVRLRAPVVKDGFSRYRKQFLETLPVPRAASSAQAAIVRAAEQGDTPRLEDLVARLFGLSERERRAIQRFLASLPSRMQTQI
ncbi:MAG: N-6 DNA methylase [Vicinamibacteria bacterium]